MTGATLRRSASRAALGRWVLGLTATFFGVATLVEGGHMLFGSGARAGAGNIVPMVLLLNWVAGFFYVGAGVSTLLRRAWAIRVAQALAFATLGLFAVFGVYILSGGAYERRTVIAMTVRSGFWVVQALLLPRVLAKGHHD